jgi:hypothetical protein
LPASKRCELEHVLAVLMDDAKRRSPAARRHGTGNGKILKILLFGSFARGRAAGCGRRVIGRRGEMGRLYFA